MQGFFLFWSIDVLEAGRAIGAVCDRIVLGAIPKPDGASTAVEKIPQRGQGAAPDQSAQVLFALAIPGNTDIVLATGVAIELVIKAATKVEREFGYVTGGEQQIFCRHAVDGRLKPGERALVVFSEVDNRIRYQFVVLFGVPVAAY